MTLQSKLDYLDQFSQDCISLEIPYTWPLVPVCGKRPYEKGWTHKSYSHPEILAELQSGKATGVGLKLGNGLLAIDIDGDSAADLLKKFAGENGLQDFATTAAWTSGRPGRRQCLFWVEEKDWSRVRNLPIGTGVIGDDGKEEKLEFRWQGWQSVLPPSLHPRTGQPYTWINDPAQHPPVQAPEWLISLCENWHTEYVSEDEIDLVRFPARLFPHFGRPLAIWVLARCSDNSRKIHGGKNKGSGVASFSLELAAHLLNRDEATIRTWLRNAVKSGLLRKYNKTGDKITCYYTSFEKIVVIAGVQDIGPIAAINIDDLSELNILATEIEAQHLQRLSMYKRQEETDQNKEPAKNPTQIVKPSDLLHPCENPARVLGKGDRFIYAESDFSFYGGSQEGIGRRRGISVSTVGRHLSNTYRLAPTPVRGHRAGMAPIVKKQLAERLPLLRGMPAKLCREDGLFFAHSDWFKPHCNVYLLQHRLISCKRRRAQIAPKTDNQSLSKFSSSPGNLEHKSLLSVLSEEAKPRCQEKIFEQAKQPEE